MDLVPGRSRDVTWLGAPLADADAAAIYDRLDRTARDLATDPGESRTVGQLRADLFRDLLLADGDGARGCGPRSSCRSPSTAPVPITADRVGAVSPQTLTDLLALATAHRGPGAGHPGDTR